MFETGSKHTYKQFWNLIDSSTWVVGDRPWTPLLLYSRGKSCVTSRCPYLSRSSIPIIWHRSTNGVCRRAGERCSLCVFTEGTDVAAYERVKASSSSKSQDINSKLTHVVVCALVVCEIFYYRRQRVTMSRNRCQIHATVHAKRDAEYRCGLEINF